MRGDARKPTSDDPCLSMPEDTGQRELARSSTTHKRRGTLIFFPRYVSNTPAFPRIRMPIGYSLVSFRPRTTLAEHVFACRQQLDRDPLLKWRFR